MNSTLKPALLAACLLTACNREAATPATASVTASHTLAVTPWSLPVDVAAAQPDLVVAPDGRLLLSWVEPRNDGHAMRFAAYDAAHWSAPRVIARGTDWFVNWADTPHLLATMDGALWAHWLRKSAVASYAYDVALVRSGDGGATWSAPTRVNDDGTPTEHGFVSLWPASPDSLGMTWLDGRETASTAEESAGHAHGGHEPDAGEGAMSLRSVVFDMQLQRRDEARLDPMTCDCCQTDVALTARGPLLVYRDRTPEEIRDIHATRLQPGGWTAARVVHADGWKMPACPVNGPSVAARGNDAVVGWYTAAAGVPTLKLARSADAGDSFGPAVTQDSGEAVQGRVDVALDAASVWVAWLREDAGGQSLQLSRRSPDLSRELARIEVARLQGRGRGTGFPQLAARNGRAYLVWTDLVAGKARLQGATVEMR
ncbi:sialidase family protein [Lysobacter fragariae]